MKCVKDNLVDVPVWPQLPNYSYYESICPQYSEGLPGVIIDVNARTIRILTGEDLLGRVENFYEKYLSGDTSFFAISNEYAEGLYEFLNDADIKNSEYWAVKGHTVGPVTWGLTVTDENKRASFHNDHLKDCVVKCMARKSEWQIMKLKEINPRVIIFLDEPYLQSIGSAAVALRPEEVAEKLDEVFEAIIGAGAVPGIHICGNSDWGLISKTKTQIINFDAYEFGSSISLYPKEISEFIERGGVIAWGVVPTSMKVEEETRDTLIAKFNEGIQSLEKHGITRDRLLEQAMITPSCGVGSLPLGTAERAISLTAEVSGALRGK
jgi:methionine synthase II (cobalamin-independent)